MSHSPKETEEIQSPELEEEEERKEERERGRETKLLDPSCDDARGQKMGGSVSRSYIGLLIP